jgi:hypothetical protein
MIEGLLIKGAVILFGGIGIFAFAFYKGKQSEKVKQLEANVKNVKEVKKRKRDRRNDDVSTVKHRMSKFVRK